MVSVHTQTDDAFALMNAHHSGLFLPLVALEDHLPGHERLVLPPIVSREELVVALPRISALKSAPPISAEVSIMPADASIFPADASSKAPSTKPPPPTRAPKKQKPADDKRGVHWRDKVIAGTALQPWKGTCDWSAKRALMEDDLNAAIDRDLTVAITRLPSFCFFAGNLRLPWRIQPMFIGSKKRAILIRLLRFALECPAPALAWSERAVEEYRSVVTTSFFGIVRVQIPAEYVGLFRAAEGNDALPLVNDVLQRGNLKTFIKHWRDAGWSESSDGSGGFVLRFDPGLYLELSEQNRAVAERGRAKKRTSTAE